VPAVVLPPLVWKRSPNVSSRNGVAVNLLVWHETAGSYRSAVSWLCNPAARASAHLVVREDGLEATQLVKLADKAWTQADFNPRAIGIEHANVTAKGYATEQQLRVSARIFGWFCLKYAIPPRWARAGLGSGICRHSDLGAAGGGHTLCGMADYDFGRFMEMVGDEIARGDYLTTWAR
jgi:N-acetyl-anhydromuramyl-L-alanine amidase AmpD